MEKTAQVFNMIKHQECISGMLNLPAGSVDLVFADPPFNIGYKYDVYQDELESDHYLNWSRKWITAVHYTLKPTGGFWLAIGDEYAAELKIISQEIGFHCRSWVIWYYTFGVNCKQKFTRSHAHLFHFVKDPENFTFRADELENRIPSARQLVYNDKRANPKGRLPDDTWIIPPVGMKGEMQAKSSGPVQQLLFATKAEQETEQEATVSPEASASIGKPSPPSDQQQSWVLRPQDVESCFTASEDTWYFPRVAGTFKERAGFHGCQMPEQLLGRIIRSCSAPDEVVLDPFSGSATTLAVAKKLGRKYLGFDISEEYIQYGKERLASIHVGDRLNGSAEPLMSTRKTGESQADHKKQKKKRGSKPHWNDPAQKEAMYAEVQLELTCQGVGEAFRLAHQGYSADRVVIDPELNASFIESCKKLGLAGDACTWNILLFRLRKEGKLNEIEITKPSDLSWEQCDPFLAASEIALQTMLHQKEGESLDEIFCDPVLAKTFDDLAAELTPGFSVFEYRWGALKIRDQAETARCQGEILYNARGSQLKRLLRKQMPISKLTTTEREATIQKEIPEQPGIYLIVGKKDEILYAGETSNLKQRLLAQSNSFQSSYWQEMTDDLSIKYGTVETDDLTNLAWQGCLAKKYKPVLNYHKIKP